jgi:serine/threonine protein kinase
VFCLGLLVLEIMTLQEPSDVFSKLCKLISRGDKEIIFANIHNKLAKDFIQACLMDDPDDRPKVADLMNHKFLVEA